MQENIDKDPGEVLLHFGFIGNFLAHHSKKLTSIFNSVTGTILCNFRVAQSVNVI